MGDTPIITPIPNTVDIASVTTDVNKYLYLPATSSIYGKTITIKDITGNAGNCNITLYTQGPDRFQDGISSNYIINKNFGYVSFFAKNNAWYLLSEVASNSISADGGLHTEGISSLSSIVSYGLSSVVGVNTEGISSLSSIVSYGLSTVYSPYGISSLSSIVSYGLSTVYSPYGISSLSSIVSYGLSSLGSGSSRGISSLSSIVSYGLSTVYSPYGISSLSSIVSYGLSSLGAGGSRGISSLSSIISYGLSSIKSGTEWSRYPALSNVDLSNYSLLNVNNITGPYNDSINMQIDNIYFYIDTLDISGAGPGISSLSSIVSYGLSSLEGGAGSGISSLSSIVSYSISSFSSIIGESFTTSSLFTNYISSGVADFSTISTQTILVGDPNAPARINIGLITPYISSTSLTATNAYITTGLGVGKPAPYWYALDVSGNTRITSIEVSSIRGDGSGLSNLSIPGISSLSSIVSYGLSSLGGAAGAGVSSLSSIISYGLSTVYSPYGISSLSSIVSYGLSSLGGAAGEGISSLSSILSYGLSSIKTTVVGGIYPDAIITNTGILYFSNATFSNATINNISNIYYDSNVGGISSLSSIVSYGLSTLYSPYGISSLSSIVSYGLSSLGGAAGEGVSSLSSIVSYGLSSVVGVNTNGISSLSSIVSYGLSSLKGAASNFKLEPSISFHPLNIGGTGILGTNTQDNNDTYTSALAKIDSWLYTNIVDQPPAPTFGETKTNTTSNIRIFWNPPPQFQIGILGPSVFVPFIQSLLIGIYNKDSISISNIINTSNYLPRYSSNIYSIYSQTAIGCNINSINMVQTNNRYTTTIIGNTLQLGFPSQTPSVFTAANQPYKVEICYINYSSNTCNILTFSDLKFAGTQFPPSAPSNTYITNNTISNVTINIGNPQYSIDSETPVIPTLTNKLSNYYITLQTQATYQTRRFPFTTYSNITSNIYCNIKVDNPAVTNSDQTNTLDNLQADTVYSIAVGADQAGYPYEGAIPYKYTTTTSTGEIGRSNLVVSQQLITDIRSNGLNSIRYTFDTYDYYPAFNVNQLVTVTGIGSNYGSSKFNITNAKIISATTSNFTVGCNITGSACNFDLIQNSNLIAIISDGSNEEGSRTRYTASNHRFTSNQYVTITGIGYTDINSATFIACNSPFNVINALIISCNTHTFLVNCNISGSITSVTDDGRTSNFQTSNITIIGARSNNNGTVIYTTDGDHGFINANSITVTGIGRVYSANFNISNRTGFTITSTSNFSFTSNIFGTACNLDLVSSCNLQFGNITRVILSATNCNTYTVPNNFRIGQFVKVSGIEDVGSNWYGGLKYNLSNVRIIGATSSNFSVGCNISGTSCNLSFARSYSNIINALLNFNVFTSSNHNFRVGQFISLPDAYTTLANINLQIVSCNTHTITVNSNVATILAATIGPTPTYPLVDLSPQSGGNVYAITNFTNNPTASVTITNAPQAFVTIANQPRATVALINNPIATVPAVNTLLPVQPPILSNFYSNTNRGLYSNVNSGLGQAIFGGNTTALSNIFNYNNNAQIIYTTNPVAIHSSNNTGLANANSPNLALFRFIGTSNRTDINNDYPLKSQYYPTCNSGTVTTTNYTTTIGTIITINGQFQDFYPNDKIRSNFYQTFTPTITVQQNFLQPSSNAYTFSVFHSNSFYSGTKLSLTYSNYADSINEVPSIYNVCNIIMTCNIYITGVPVYSYNNLLTNAIDIENLAKYFFVASQNLLLANYSNVVGASSTAIIPGRCNWPIGTKLFTQNSVEQLTAPLSNITRFITTLSINCNTLYTPASNEVPTFTIYTQLCNLFGINNPSSNLPFYFDGPSQVLIETIINSATAVGGLRMESGSNISDPGANTTYLSTTPYDNKSNIKLEPAFATLYNNELPIVNGRFRSALNLGDLYKYIENYQTPSQSLITYNSVNNYEGINVNETTNTAPSRYATFKYSFTNSAGAGSNVYKFEFTLVGGIGFGSNSDSTYNSAISNLQYRVNTTAPGQCNSFWINGNRFRTDGQGQAGVGPLAFNSTVGLRSCNAPRTPITLTNRFFSVTPISNTTIYDIYVRIGLRGNCNIAFSNITMEPFAGQVPFAPSNLTLVQTNLNRSNTALVFSWSNPRVINPELTFDYYQYSIIATQCNTRPRRWVPSFVNGRQDPLYEPYFSEFQYYNRIYLSNTSNFSYSNSFSNYDTPYVATVSFANDVGIGASNQITSNTPLPIYTSNTFTATNATNFDLNPEPSRYYYTNTRNIFNFSQRTLGPLSNVLDYNLMPQRIVLDYKGSNGLFSNSYNVNDATQPGGSLSNCFYNTVWNNGSSNIEVRYTFINDLYYASNTTSNLTVTSNTLTLSVQKIQDQYSAGQATGFYMNTYANIVLSNGFDQMVLQRNGFSNSNVFTLSLCNAATTNTITTRPYWIDNAVANQPRITNIDVDPAEITTDTGTYSNYVCGVLCFSGSNTNSFYVGVSNLGSYYFMSNALIMGLCNVTGSIIGAGACNFPFNNTTTDFYSGPGATSNYRLAPLSNPTYFRWPINFGRIVYTPSNTFAFCNVTACNLHNKSVTCNVTYFGYQGQNMFFDTESITVMKATLNSNYSDNSPGARIESGPNPGPFDGYVTIGASGLRTFNQLCNLNVGSYSNELQLANGAYRTFCNATLAGAKNGYLDYTGFYNPYSYNSYADYTNYTKPQYQYLTLKWFVPSGNTDWQSAIITFGFLDITTRMLFSPSIANINNVNFSNITILYKIVASNDISATETNFTTAWLNANCNIGRPAKPSRYNKNSNGFPGGLYDAANTNNRLTVYFPETLNGASYSNINFSFYLQIGVPSNSNVAFNYVTLQINNTDNLPGKGLSLITQHSNSLKADGSLSNATITWTRADDGISIKYWNYVYRVITNTVAGILYPRKYVRSSATLIVSDSNGVNGTTCNIPDANEFNTTDFTASFRPSNYDTYHTITVYASNVSGRGESNIDSNSLNRTPLPQNTGSNFGDSLQLTNMNSAKYNSILSNNFGTMFANRSFNVPLSNIFSSNALYPAVGSCNFTVFAGETPVTGITINPLETFVGTRTSNVNWIVTLSNVTTRSEIARFNYRFTNEQVYNTLNSNYQVVNNTSFIWSNLNTTDIYFNGPLNAAGFYGVTTPSIALKASGAPPSSNQYSLTLYDSNRSEPNTNSIQFYLDNQNLLRGPTGRIFLDNSNSIPIGSYCNVCGIPVITTNTFNFWIQTSNIGSYFFHSNAVNGSFTDLPAPVNTYTYTFNTINTPFYSSSNTNSLYTASPISNTTYFYWSNITLLNTTYRRTFGPPTVVLCNIASNGGTTISVPFAPYFDSNSVALLASNVRVISGSGPAPGTGTYGQPYNNNSNLLVGIYSNELQIVNGAYRTRGGGGFCNYISNIVPSVETTYTSLGDYSDAPTDVFRYATFLFTGSTTNVSNKVDTISFTVNWSINPPSGSTQNNAYDSNTVQIRLKFGSNAFFPPNNDATSWMNMNSCNTPVRQISYSNKANSGIACTSNFSQPGTFIIKVPDGIGYNPFSNYIKIGMYMASNVAFTNVTYNSQSEINVPNLFTRTSNFTLSNETFTLTWNLVSGMPTNLYFNLCNIILKRNSDESYSNYQISNVILGPTTSNYQVIRNLYSDTSVPPVNYANGYIYPGTYCNVATIYQNDGITPIWTSNFVFTIPNYGIDTLSNLTVSNTTVTPAPNADLGLTTISFTRLIGLSNPPYQGGFISYYALSNSARYYASGAASALSDSNRFNCNTGPYNIDSDITYINTFTPSNYGATYVAFVSMSNYSQLVPVTIGPSNSATVTPLPSNIGSNFGRSLQNVSNVANYNYDGYIFGSIGSGLINKGLILNCNVLFEAGGLSYKFMNYAAGSAVSTITVNSGTLTSGSNLSNVTYTVNLIGGTTPLSCNYQFTNTLYGLVPYSNIVLSNAAVNFSISTRDMYSNHPYKSGFYMTATPTIQLNASIIPPSSNIYALTFGTNSLDGASSNTCNFYVDSLTGAPTGAIFVENTGGISFCNICGISVITSSNFNFWIAASNIGRYFIYSNAVTASLGSVGCNFRFNIATTPFYNNCNSGSLYTATPISNTTYFYWSNVTVPTSYGQTFNSELSLYLSNLNSGSALISGPFKPYFDPLSIILMNCNVRVTSGGACNNPAVGTFGAPYNNNITIYGGPNTNEILLFNNAYRLPNTNYNINYSGSNLNPLNSQITQPNNYGSIDNSTRYITFLFSNINTTNTYYKLSNITLSLKYFDTNTLPAPDGSYLYNNIAFYIRINATTPLSNNDSSGWLNANAINTIKNISISNKIIDNTTITSLLSNDINGNNTNIHNFTILIPDGCGYSNMNLYTRFGGGNNNVALQTITITGQSEINIPSFFTVRSNTPNNTNTYNDITTITFNTNNFGLPSNLYYYQLSNVLYSNGSPIALCNSIQNMSPLSNSYTILTYPGMPRGTYSNKIEIWTHPDLGPYKFFTSNYILNVSGRAPLASDFSMSVINNNTLNVGVQVALTNNLLQPRDVSYYFKASNVFPNAVSNVTPSNYVGPYNLTTSASSNFIDYNAAYYNSNINQSNISLWILASNTAGSIESNIRASTGPQCNVDLPVLSNTFTATINCNTGAIRFNGGVAPLSNSLGALTWDIYKSNTALPGGPYSGPSDFTVYGIEFSVPNGSPSNYYYNSAYRIIASNSCNVAGWGLPQSASNSVSVDGPPLPSNFTITLSNNNSLGVYITTALNNSGLPTCNWFYYSVSNMSATKTDDTTLACNIYTQYNITLPQYDGPYEFGTPVRLKYDPYIYSQDFQFYVYGSNYLGAASNNIITASANTGPQCNVDVPVLCNFTVTINCNVYPTGDGDSAIDLTFTGLVYLSNGLGSVVNTIIDTNSIINLSVNGSGSFNCNISLTKSFLGNSDNQTNFTYLYNRTYTLDSINTSNGWITANATQVTYTTGFAPLPDGFIVELSNNSNLGVYIIPQLPSLSGLPNCNWFYYSVANTSLTKTDGSTPACNISTSNSNYIYPTFEGPYQFGTPVGIVYDTRVYAQNFNFYVYGGNYIGITETSNIFANTGDQITVDTPQITFNAEISVYNGDITFTASVILPNQLGLVTWNIYSNSGPVYDSASSIPLFSPEFVGEYSDSINLKDNNSLDTYYNTTYTLFASNTCNDPGWISGFTSISNIIFGPRGKISDFSVSVSNDSSLGVYITPTLQIIPGLQGLTNEFYYSVENVNENKDNDNISKVNPVYTTDGYSMPDYYGPYPFGTPVGISYDPQVYDQSIKFYIYGNNEIENTSSSPCNVIAYTGPQCNVSVPALTFNTTINCNTGDITFTGSVLADIIGDIFQWNIYSNSIPLFDPNFVGISNSFTLQCNAISDLPSAYYNTTYTLIAANYCNVPGWGLSQSNISNYTIGPPPLPNFTVSLSNNDSLGVYITPTLLTTSGLPTNNYFYYSVSNTSLTKTDNITPACNISTSNSNYIYPTFEGPYEFGTPVGITNDVQVSLQNFNFYVYGSNIWGITPTSNIPAYTGGILSAGIPTIGDFIVNLNNNTGIVTTTATIDITGTRLDSTAIVTFSNINTGISCNSPTSNFNTFPYVFTNTYSNSASFLQLFSNVVTLNVTNGRAGYTSQSSNRSSNTAPYIVSVTPILCNVRITGSFNSYTFSTSNTNWASVSLPRGTSLGAIYTVQSNFTLYTPCNVTINPTYTVSNASNVSFTGFADSYYFISARFRLFDSGNSFIGDLRNTVNAIKLYNIRTSNYILTAASTTLPSSGSGAVYIYSNFNAVNETVTNTGKNGASGNYDKYKIGTTNMYHKYVYWELTNPPVPNAAALNCAIAWTTTQAVNLALYSTSNNNKIYFSNGFAFLRTPTEINNNSVSAADQIKFSATSMPSGTPSCELRITTFFTTNSIF